jgi:tetratricopeptide (TPR) repeat protein
VAKWVRFAAAVAVLSACFGEALGTNRLGQTGCEPWLAEVVSVQGLVDGKRFGGEWLPVRLHDRLCEGDAVRTGRYSRAALWLSSEAIFRLDEETTITFLRDKEPKTSWIDLLKGAAHFISRIPRTLKVRTPFVNAAVEGTEFALLVEPTTTKLWVLEGSVRASNQRGELLLANLQSAIARSGHAPERWLVVKPRDAIQWTLYYPPLFDPRSTALSKAPEKVAEALRLYTRGDVQGALSALKKVRTTARDRGYYNLSAALYLSVGQVAEARSAIERSLALEPANGDAVALQSVLALVRNELDRALDLAQQATESAPDSPVPRIALSYAYQGAFQLDKALESARHAVEIDPDNALAWTRVAEIELSIGELGKALDAAAEAVRRNPRLARTQTVLGFAYLARIDVDAARSAFEKAIDLDQTDPLPRLGLGLAKIRRGALAEGRQEIEIATSLDPNNSLIRSYLGKAYFEEKRNTLAQSQLSMAKELDPKDPTPWFYDAILKQTENRPVEALHDAQESIELNDNRAVYRSRLLLDFDEATRGASLGRIYRDLGFEQLALAEGWKSLNLDPGSYSAHRLLADTYAVLPRHELARVSELLQSQLRQPLNHAPLQPQLATAETFILQGTGPSDAAFNELTPLFTRDGVNVLANGVIGGNDIRGYEMVLSPLWGRLAISAGHFHYDSSGFRLNNDQDQDIYNLFAQLQLAPGTSLQVEYQTRELDRGDLRLRFDPENFDETERQLDRESSTRLGLHYTFGPHADLIAHVTFGNFDYDIEHHSETADTIAGQDSDGYLAEIQYLHAWGGLEFLLGGGASESEDLFGLDTTLHLYPGFSIPFSSVDEWSTRHSNAYLYLYANFWKPLMLTLAASLQSMEDLNIDRNQLNPKLGITWSLTPRTTLRAAAFRFLSTPLLGNQTIEPTQVAGFNQLFDDALGSDTWRYGLGIDHRWSADLHGGMEFSKRDLDVPLTVQDPTLMTFEQDFEERFGRGYLYWTPHERWALRAEYQYEKFERELGFAGPEEFTHLRTHRLVLGAGYFHPAGFRTSIQGTYLDQEGEFTSPTDPLNPDAAVPGQDSFWVLDASLGYRLPKRLGLVSLSAKNLLDQSFSFQDTDPANPDIIPERLIVLTLNLVF